MNLRNVKGILECVLPVNARMWTWEVSFPYDEEPSDAQLLEMYKADFPIVSLQERPLFLKMVAFNSDSGRKIRYLVVLRGDVSFELDKRHDRLLPSSLIFYGIADEVIRGENHEICENVLEIENRDFEGNAVFSFLQNNRLFILCFYAGRLCHWSEETGYEDGFSGFAYENRMERFIKFLEQDEFFSQESNNKFNKYRKNMDLCSDKKIVSAYFRRATCDPYWNELDLDFRKRIKPFEQKKLFVVTLLLLFFLIVLSKNFEIFEKEMIEIPSVYVENDVELLAPPIYLPSSEVHDSLYRDSFFRNFRERNEKNEEPLKNKLIANSLGDENILSDIKLRSIVEGVVFQGFVKGVLKWFREGDSISYFQVKSIKRDRVILNNQGRIVELLNE